MSYPDTEKLLSYLRVERIDRFLFTGNSPRRPSRIFGGQVLAQSLNAAIRSVEGDRIAHSMHAYFLLGGDPKAPIIYDVERIRDGGSFTTRRVKAIQHGRAIFSMSVSFHRPEDGFEHASEMPEVADPNDLPSEAELNAALAQQLPDNMRSYLARERPIEMRPVDASRYQSREPRAPKQCVWMRASGTMPDDLPLHQAVLAYASDFTLLDTALIAHGKHLFDQDIQLASLDHAMWLHRPFRADQWLLYVQDSPTAVGARGFCRGTIYARDGRLVASTAQEGLTRPRDSAFVVS